MMMWIFFLCLLTSAVPRASNLSGNYRVELDTKVGDTILIRTWSLNGTTLSISVKCGEIICLTTSFPGNYDSSQKVQNDRLMPNYNLTSNEASLIFNNVSGVDEGLYHLEESFYKTNTELYDEYKGKDGGWNFHLNVIEPGEVVRGYVGENVSMEFSKPSKLSFLYRYDQKVAILHESGCHLLPGTHFNGRLRCSSQESNTTYKIIIQSVTQRDTGLYKVVMDDTVRERRFLNTTGITNSSIMNPVTLQGSLTKTQLHQVSTDAHYSQRSPVSSSNTVKPTTVGIPDYVIPVVIGVVGVIIMMIGFLIWIQRRNTNGMEIVQRVIVEKCETDSFDTPTTVRRAMPMPARKERRTDLSVPQLKALHDAVVDLYCAVDTVYSSIHSLEKRLDDKPRLHNILNCNQSSERSNKLPAACDKNTEMGILGECPSVCRAAGIEEHNSICIVQRKVAESIQALFAKVEDEPSFSSKYYNDFTATGNADRLCGYEYEMADISIGVDPKENLQDVEIASESTKAPVTSFPGPLGPRKIFVHGTEGDNGFKRFENIMNATSEQNVKVSGEGQSLTIKDEEPKEEKISSGIASNDYADIGL